MDERDRLKSYFRMLSVNDPYRGNELVDVLDAYLDAKFKRKWQGLTLTQVKLLWEGVQEEAVKSGDSLNWVFYTHINEALKEKNT